MHSDPSPFFNHFASIENTNLSILGSGWLGSGIGISLINIGYKVKATTTTISKIPSLYKQGFEPYLLKLTTDPSLMKKSINKWLSFLETSVLIICIPPKRTAQIIEYVMLIENLVKIITNPNIKIIFISSTSVYLETGKEVDETSNDFSKKENGIAIKKAEDLLTSHFHKTTILRLGGLIGEGRGAKKLKLIKKKLISDKEIILNNTPVNFIHKKDVVGIVSRIIELKKWSEVFNVVAPDHPKRKEYYLKTAQKIGLSHVKFKSDKKKIFKIVSSQKLIKKLNYDFLYPNLKSWLHLD